MSYIPRRPAAADERLPPGRVDEIRSLAAAAAAATAAGASSPTAQPASRRSSIAHARSNISPLPSLPPLPDADSGALGIGKAASIAPPQSTRRRTVSTSGESRNAPEKTAGPIKQSKPRRGLASLRVVWPSSKARRSKSIEAPTERARWTAEDTATVAQASLRAWKSGYPVERDSLAADVGRSAADVSEMLEYMLEGYARFGSAACWDSQSPKFIMRWAAVEFPSNLALNPPADRPRSAVSRLDTYFSALTCRPRSVTRDATYALDSPEEATSGRATALDFREEMRLRGVEAFPAHANERTLSESSPAATVDLNSVDGEQPVPQGAPRARERSRSVVGVVQLPERRATVLRDANVQTEEPAPVAPAPQPTRSGSRRTSMIVAGSMRSPRTRSIRRSPARVEGGGTTPTGPDPPAWNPDSPFAPFAFSPLPAAAASVPAPPATRPRAATVAESGQVDRRSRDSGTVEMPVPVPDTGVGASDTHSFDLTPDLSRLTVEVGELDDSLDASFADIGAEARRKVRRFVAQFIQAYPSEFQKRVRDYKRKKNVLCLPADSYRDFDRHSRPSIMAIEAIHQERRGDIQYSGNMFFHCQFVRAVRIDHIPATEETWTRVNDFATEVFNWRIINADLVVMQEYMARDNDGEGGAETSRSRNWMLGGHVDADALVDEEDGGRESPFGKARFMDRKAQNYVDFLDDMMGDKIRQRAKDEGPRPIPVAVLPADVDSMLPVDQEVRSKIQSFIQEDLPDSTAATKELLLLRALEHMNAHMAKLSGYHEGNVAELLSNVNSDGAPAEDRTFVAPAEVQGIPSSQLAQAAGRAFARVHFGCAKSAFLLAMLSDHPFRPVSRDEVKLWMARDGSPFGKDVDYRLNVGLYRYLRQLNLRPSSRQWLQTSAAATLSMLRRVANALDDQSYIEHLNIGRYEREFSEAVRSAPSSNGGGNGGSGS
ncbi:hypothetical protein H4R21_002993, partial [Coemansia helicoidea]